MILLLCDGLQGKQEEMMMIMDGNDVRTVCYLAFWARHTKEPCVQSPEIDTVDKMGETGKYKSYVISQ